MSAPLGVTFRPACSRDPLPPVRAQGIPERRTALPQPGREEFEKLLAFRVSLRRFQRWSEDQATAAGLTHVQHQLIVAIKGHPGDTAPSIAELADYLMLRHHSTVELVNRAVAAGVVRRDPDPDDARVVRVDLTRKGDRLVTELTEAHIAELHKLAAALNDLLPLEQAGHAPALSDPLGEELPV